MTEQLNLIGDQAQPHDEELGRTQRAVMRVLRRVGRLSRDEVGAIAHAGRQRHAVDERCMWCGVDADAIIDSLVARRLVDRTRDGHVRLPLDEPDSGDALQPHDGIPY